VKDFWWHLHKEHWLYASQRTFDPLRDGYANTSKFLKYNTTIQRDIVARRHVESEMWWSTLRECGSWSRDWNIGTNHKEALMMRMSASITCLDVLGCRAEARHGCTCRDAFSGCLPCSCQEDWGIFVTTYCPWTIVTEEYNRWIPILDENILDLEYLIYTVFYLFIVMLNSCSTGTKVSFRQSTPTYFVLSICTFAKACRETITTFWYWRKSRTKVF
jgi:hypothetical protein